MLPSTTVVCADVLDWAAGYEGEKFHAILCDPSYGLGDYPDIEAMLTAWLSGDDYDMGPGFMGKDWDVLPGPKYWAAIRRHCHPGAYLFAFGGTRTADLLSLSIRLGGWERFDEIDSLSWVYGSGFPKSHNIGKAIDKAAGAEWEVVGQSPYASRRPKPMNGTTYVMNETKWDISKGLDETTPATDLAATWEGYGTALKPAHEPILCFRNPKTGTYAENCTSTGAGALNIDGGRVACNDKAEFPASIVSKTEQVFGGGNGRYADRPRTQDTQPAGRWPPNVVLSHISPDADGNGGCVYVGTQRVKGVGWDKSSPETAERKDTEDWRFNHHRRQGYADPDGLETVEEYRCVEGCPIRELGEQSGERKSGVRHNKVGEKGAFKATTCYNPSNGRIQENHFDASTGIAARFYPNHDWQYEITERLAGVTPFRYVAKAARKERDAGLERFPVAKAEHNTTTNYCGRCDKRVNSNGSGVKCECGDKRVTKHKTTARNPHPTVKPIKLCQWLATLLLPPPEYAPRRILVPFGGSGSEAIGAGLAGWDEIVMVEMEQEYVEITEARLAHWLANIQMELGL